MRRLGLPGDDIEEQFRRMVFNVAARNQDDHVKNIAFLMDAAGQGPVELLLIDAQGAELPFLESLGDAAVRGLAVRAFASNVQARYLAALADDSDWFDHMMQLRSAPYGADARAMLQDLNRMDTARHESVAGRM